MHIESLITGKLEAGIEISISARFYHKGVDYSVSLGGENGEEVGDFRQTMIDWSDDLIQYLIRKDIFYNWDATLYLNSGEIQISMCFYGPYDDLENQTLVFEDDFIEDLNKLNKSGVVVEIDNLFVDFEYSIVNGFSKFIVHEYSLNEDQIDKIKDEILIQLNPNGLRIEDMFDCTASCDMECRYNDVDVSSVLGPATISWDELYSKKS